MEFCLVPSQAVTFVRNNLNNPDTRGLITQVMGRVCKNPEDDGETEHKFSSMLKNSLAKQSMLLGSKRQRTDPSPDFSLMVVVCYNINTGNSFFKIGHQIDENHLSWFSRMQSVCGGVDKFTLDADMILCSDEEDKIKVEVRSEQVGKHPKWAGLHHEFTLPIGIIQTWETASGMGAQLSVKMKLSDDAVERIYLDNMENPLLANKAMLMDSSTTDAILVAANGAHVKCHKGFLSAHSDVFKAMFESELKNENSTTIQLPEMNESSVRALLAYLYCWEIKEISRSSSIALELLVAADKYNIPKLLDSAKDLILSKENEWYTPSVTVRLLQFARKKGDLGEEEKYKMIKDKCVAVLKSISKEDLHECLDYQQLFVDQQAGMEFCSYLFYS